jgi:hypothetical protein
MSQELIKKAHAIQEARRRLRNKEQSLKSRSKLLSNQPLVSTQDRSLRSNLEKILPKYLVPKNIGNYSEVMWPFWYAIDFDFGTDPTYTNFTKQVESIQVSMEAAFLLTGISRSHDDRGPAGQQAPLQLTIRDNQSSRQFNDKAFPIQTIGLEGEPTLIDTPLFLAPNASVSLEMSSWTPSGSEFETVGDGRVQIVLSGWRIRTDDASKVLASIFL